MQQNLAEFVRISNYFHCVMIVHYSVNALLNLARETVKNRLLDKPAERSMKILIVESQPELGRIWKSCLERQEMDVDLVGDQESAFEALRQTDYDIIILDLVLTDGKALSIADYASYRRPNARVIFVTNTTFFSDGSIFQMSSNACAFVQSATPPEDLAAMVQHYATAS
jgi:DNA-binding NtrC family response regulator